MVNVLDVVGPSHSRHEAEEEDPHHKVTLESFSIIVQTKAIEAVVEAAAPGLVEAVAPGLVEVAAPGLVEVVVVARRE